MILGLPVSTFLWIFAAPAAGLLVSFLYGLCYRDDDSWLTIEDLFHGKNKKEDAHK